MASIIVSKPLTQVECNVLNSGVQPQEADVHSLESWGVDGIVIDHMLSRTECNALVSACEDTNGFCFWDPEGETDFKRKMRNADTLEFDSESLCGQLFSRLRRFMPEHVDIMPEQQRYEPDLEGRWEIRGLNTHLLVNRYGEGGHFAPHADAIPSFARPISLLAVMAGSTELSFDLRSLYTVLIYLNDCPEGGSTLLLRDEQHEVTTTDASGAAVAKDQSIVHRVQPEAGRALVYWHQTMHSGERVGAGCAKYCLRSDIMYERVPKACVTEQDFEAYQLYQRARALEASGAAMEALPLFMRCAKLSRTMKKAYRL